MDERVVDFKIQGAKLVLGVSRPGGIVENLERPNQPLADVFFQDAISIGMA